MNSPTTSEMVSGERLVEKAAMIHANMYVFDAIVEILEGSCQPRGARAQRVSARIIKICKQEISAQLDEYDNVVAEITGSFNV